MRWAPGTISPRPVWTPSLWTSCSSSPARTRRLSSPPCAPGGLTYGDIFGQPAFLEGICRLYRDLRPEQVIPTHGAAGANHHLFCSLVEPGDKVISVLPTYQQLYSIPDALGAQVELLPLSPDNGFLPDLARLEELAVEASSSSA